MKTFSGAIREQDFEIGKMSFEEEQAICSKNIVLWETFSNYWRPRIELGKECFDALIGEIFTASEKKEFDRQDKLLLSVPEILSKILALEGMQIAGRREGVIVAEGAEDAPDTEVATRILKSINTANAFNRESTAAFIDAMVTSYPSFIFWDKGTEWTNENGLQIYHEAWDAVLPDPNFRMVDLKDAERLIRVKAVTKEKAKEMYPERAEEIERRIKENPFDQSTWLAGSTFTAAERNTVFFHLNSAADIFTRTGLIYVIESLHFVYKTGTVWVRQGVDTPEVLPPEWSEEEVAKWQQLHPDYHPVQRKVRTLWVTSSSNSGVLLENKAHWFQENEFPCEMLIPKMFDNMPYGIVQFLKGSQKLKNAARIEHLHSLRLANDNLMKIKEGSVKNAEDLEAESGRVGGKIIIDKDAEMTDVEIVGNRREQLGWMDLASMAGDDIDRIFIDKNFEGGVQSSQESGKAIQKRIQQSQMKQSPFMDAYNFFDLRCQRKSLLMMPYCYTEYAMFRYVDETNHPKVEEVNKPVEFDWATGAVTRLKNNLAGAKYDYREAQGDNSATGKEHELAVFTEVLHNVLPGVDMTFWPFLLQTIPNRLAQEFGRKIQEHMQAQAEQPQGEPLKKTLAFQGKDLLYNPLVQQIVQQLLQQEGVQLGIPQGGAPGQTPSAATPPAVPAQQGVM